ncbi:Hsp20/alpha crystallin family protein, partial [Methyloceanibacter marginalis]|uniref:Hsp20/alpha crystallin family protein n=1 Tax=Methyloceanibacter marginalis TaxID=1774971 RepID=UPI000AD5BE06
VIITALPGVAPDAVRAEIEGATLIITGMRPLPCAGRRANIVRLEIPYGRFERRIALSDRLQLAARELQNGCLILTFTKTG